MKRKILAGTLVFFGTALAGCGGGYSYRAAFVGYGPPAPRYGVIGVAPGPGYAWVDGYWGCRGNRYAWIEGRWDRPPLGYRTWARGEWFREGRGWRFREGYWR
jgi:hypothetical protein